MFFSSYLLNSTSKIANSVPKVKKTYISYISCNVHLLNLLRQDEEKNLEDFPRPDFIYKSIRFMNRQKLAVEVNEKI